MLDGSSVGVLSLMFRPVDVYTYSIIDKRAGRKWRAGVGGFAIAGFVQEENNNIYYTITK